MHVDIVPNRGSPPAILLRESWREGARVRKRTLANITKDVTLEQALLMRRVLAGERLVSPSDAFEQLASRSHGHVMAVLAAMRRLGVEKLLASRPSAERDMVLALIAQRLIKPASKLASTRAWRTTTLIQELGLPAEVGEDDAYRAMDWLAARKERIEAKLAQRHLREGSLVRFDLSSTYVEGEHCALAEFGFNRDKKRGKKQINWGLLTDVEGRPISLSLYPGSTADPASLSEQVSRLRERFKIDSFTLVGDRGMITGKHIQQFHDRNVEGIKRQASDDGSGVAGDAAGAGRDGVAGGGADGGSGGARIDWITALASVTLKKLVEQGVIQASLFDERNLFEITHVDYPGERLIACRNPVLGRKRAHKRRELVNATLVDLGKIKARVDAGKLQGADKIGVAVGAKLGKHKMGKHITLTITDTTLEFAANNESLEREATMDGIYVIRTSLAAETMSSAATVRAYKDLSRAERAFRTIKGLDLSVRPVHHRLLERVTAHFLICTLAYYVRWFMERAWASITFADEHATDPERDPVAPAKRSQAATRKAQTGKLANGEATHSFASLLADLSSIQRTTCRERISGATFPLITTPTHAQQHALDLLNSITV
jgi:uncharacterized membrane protein YgcG